MALLDLLRSGGRRRQPRPSGLIDPAEAPAPVIPPPRKLGISTDINLEPWSAARLATLFRDAERNPCAATFDDARLARHRLSQFWLAAPLDQLESFYSGCFGELQRLMLSGPLISQELARDERRWRRKLIQQLENDVTQPARLNLLLAAMLYVPSGKMRVEKPSSYLPEWLIEDYIAFCDPALADELRGPIGFLQSAEHVVAEPLSQVESQQVPQLDQRRGAQALEILADSTYTTRMQGLINLHAIDPNDPEVNEQLADLRRLLSQLWLDTPAGQLEVLHHSSTGDLYRALLRSRFGASPLSNEDRELRAALLPLVDDLSTPGAAQALLAAMPFFPPEKIEPAGGMEHLPSWLQVLIMSLQ